MDIKLQTNLEDPKLEFLNIEKYSDESGFGSTIHVISNGFTAMVLVTFEIGPMREFINQLKACNLRLAGSATLKPLWENWFIAFTINGTGQLAVNGKLHSAGQELSFNFMTDQTCLNTLIDNFETWQK
ncbi:WapI family immunity protein [Arenicella xantha]|uniref:Uncharacterized protein n=1 Tax=Arenicella xantha TaxID=644221 RepID=A0A395JF88_9GAMM|nr:hypothetical protein [Arenicella xantha]RBP45616.1 hypothetical protein DFR28_1185 [Arenicella xantha]